jgi:predicted PolB exonuclease-like 3'-5' exonuclease
MHGGEVWDAYLSGGIGRIRAYCETDVMNTYLIYLRFQLLRGNLNRTEHAQEEARVRKLLQDSSAAHWQEFLAAWPEI